MLSRSKRPVSPAAPTDQLNDEVEEDVRPRSARRSPESMSRLVDASTRSSSGRLSKPSTEAPSSSPGRAERSARRADRKPTRRRHRLPGGEGARRRLRLEIAADRDAGHAAAWRIRRSESASAAQRTVTAAGRTRSAELQVRERRGWRGREAAPRCTTRATAFTSATAGQRRGRVCSKSPSAQRAAATDRRDDARGDRGWAAAPVA